MRINLKAVFPCAFTVGNLLSGFLAITATISHNLEIAAGFICLGAILDGLDSTLARALRGSSRFGREFDSLADFVTFGIAPMVMVYSYLSHTIGFGALVLTAVFITAGAFRLIRHNLESHEAVHGYVELDASGTGLMTHVADFVQGEIPGQISGVQPRRADIHGVGPGLRRRLKSSHAACWRQQFHCTVR